MPAYGYESSDYGKSFLEFGEILTLPHSGIQVLKRSISTDYFDVIGNYPFTVCSNWAKLNEDIGYLRKIGAVSMVLVTDPFSESKVRESFSHWKLCVPFKTQFLIDLKQNWRVQRAQNTRNSTNQAMKLNDIENVEGKSNFADLFWSLYQQSIVRHKMTGIQQMSRLTIEKQLSIEGMLLVISRKNNIETGALICSNQGETAHMHLMGLSDNAYKYKSSYALIYSALEALEKKGCHYFNLGGSAGGKDNPDDGLFQFKRRWSNGQRKSMLCGEILDQNAYAILSEKTASSLNSFFPAYRSPGSQYEWRIKNIYNKSIFD